MLNQIIDRPKVEAEKLLILFKKAADKEFNSVALQMAATQYFYRLHRCLIDNEAAPSEALIEILQMLLAKNKNGHQVTLSKFLSWNYESINWFGVVLVGLMNLFTVTTQAVLIESCIIANVRERVGLLVENGAEIYGNKLKWTDGDKTSW